MSDPRRDTVPGMTPDELKTNYLKTHVRYADEVPDDDRGFDTARILEHKANGDGDVPVQFESSGYYGTVELAAIGDTLELYCPLLDAPEDLWFVGAHTRDHPMFSLGPTLPTGLRHGPYTTEKRDQMIRDDDTWLDNPWRRYRLVEEKE